MIDKTKTYRVACFTDHATHEYKTMNEAIRHVRRLQAYGFTGYIETYTVIRFKNKRLGEFSTWIFDNWRGLHRDHTHTLISRGSEYVYNVYRSR